MSEEEFEIQYEAWEKIARDLNEKLYTYVHAEIDINSPDWEEQVINAPHPADESGLRDEIQSLFNVIVSEFEYFDLQQRGKIIELMNKNDSLMHSAVIDADIKTKDGFRKFIILFIIDDQGKDARDAIMALSRYRAHAEKFGIDVDSAYEELANIASDIDKYGMGSTRELLLKY